VISAISTGSDLTNADIVGTIFEGDYPAKIKLSHTSLLEAVQNGDDLSNMDMTGANLSGLNLSGMDMSNSILIRADLSNADLTDTNLSNSILGSANWGGPSCMHINHNCISDRKSVV
jgi:uncharacterized protein YjbI with pentapeptide repeats